MELPLSSMRMTKDCETASDHDRDENWRNHLQQTSLNQNSQEQSHELVDQIQILRTALPVYSFLSLCCSLLCRVVDWWGDQLLRCAELSVPVNLLPSRNAFRQESDSMRRTKNKRSSTAS